MNDTNRNNNGAKILTKEQFFEDLSTFNPEYGHWVKRLKEQLEAEGYIWEYKISSVTLRKTLDNDKSIRFMSIKTNGNLELWATERTFSVHSSEVVDRYFNEITDIVPDTRVDVYDNGDKFIHNTQGKSLSIDDFILHKDHLLKSMEIYAQGAN